MSERDRESLINILDAIALIESWTLNGRVEFDQSEMMRDAILYRLTVIGEAVARLSNEAKAHDPQIEWRKITRLRNIVVHDYAGVDLNIIWLILEEDLPVLKAAINNVLQK